MNPETAFRIFVARWATKGASNVIWFLGAFIVALILLVVIVLLISETQSAGQSGWQKALEGLGGILG